MRNLDLNGKLFDVVSKFSWDSSQTCNVVVVGVAEGRVRKGITISRRTRSAPLPLQTNASFIACLVGPAAMYGFSAGGFTPRLVSSLRTTVVAAL